MKVEEIREIVDALTAGGWDYASVTSGGMTITVGNPPTGVVPVQAALKEAVPAVADTAAASTAVPTPQQVSGAEVLAPSVGVFWHASKPGAEAFVQVGQRVEVGDTLGILEVMKLFSPVTTEVAGTVRALVVDNGGMVEHGDVIAIIEPEAS